jgi:radical SAM protein with 4Fe4S-binding SPASM domain
MGLAYSKLLKEKFNITSETNWRGLLRNTEDFNEINTIAVAHQIEKIKIRFRELNKNLIFLPPTYSPENLSAYFTAHWNAMTDKYISCPVPWAACDITANGDVAQCHVFYDLVMGNLHEQSFEEIWNGVNYQRFREYMNEHKFMSICPGCCILYLAGQKK